MQTPTSFATTMLAALAVLAVSGCDDPEATNTEERSVEIPVIVDGVRLEPEDMEDLKDETLYFYLDAAAQEEGVIYAFTDPADEAAFAAEREPVILEQEASQLTFRAPLNNSKFYDGDYYSGHFGNLSKGESISNLGAHPDYNNNDITSVKCRANAYTYLFDDTGFGGAWLRCRNINIPHLNAYGWNQRASSLEVTP